MRTKKQQRRKSGLERLYPALFEQVKNHRNCQDWHIYSSVKPWVERWVEQNVKPEEKNSVMDDMINKLCTFLHV